MPENVVNIDNLVKSVLRYRKPIIPIETIHMLLGKLMFTEQTCDITPYNHLENINRRHPERYAIGEED
mgnify:CR=1 FL=1